MKRDREMRRSVQSEVSKDDYRDLLQEARGDVGCDPAVVVDGIT